jgi:hypothetical protein
MSAIIYVYLCQSLCCIKNSPHSQKSASLAAIKMTLKYGAVICMIMRCDEVKCLHTELEKIFNFLNAKSF